MILILVFTLINTSHLCKCHVRNFRVKNLKAQKFEPFNAMEWVNGSIPEVVEKAVKGGKVFVVVIEGENRMYCPNSSVIMYRLGIMCGEG